MFYDIEGCIYIILDSLTKLKSSERDILTKGFLERLLNLLGQYLMDSLFMTSQDLVSKYVNLYYGIMDKQDFT